MKDVMVLGVGQSVFGKFKTTPWSSLATEAVKVALADAGVDGREVQTAYTSRLYSDMITGQTVLKNVGIAGIEMTNVENACAGGSTAVHALWKDIAAGYCDVGIALGVESVTTSPIAGKLIPPAPDDLDGRLGLTMPVLFALQARRLMETHGATEADFAQVSVKAHDFGALNPLAQYRKRLTLEEVLASRPIAEPLRLLEACPNTDGAAAVLLCSPEFARRHTRRAVRIRASVLRSGDFFHKKDDLTSFEVGTRVADLAYTASGIDPSELDLVELHDAFASEELVHYEDLRLCPRGDAVKLLRDGATSMGGRIPVNPSGGLLSLGHPLSASGVRVVGEIALQLRGQAGDRQVSGARVGLAQMLGGVASGLETGAASVQVLSL